MRFFSHLLKVFGVLSAFLAFLPFMRGAPNTDLDIQKIVSEISSERIQRSVYVLSSFKTRHTLSDPLPSGDGIGGAASWIKAEFERVAAASGGRLRVQTDSFLQPISLPRVPHPVQLINIVATLPGTDPASENRVYVVSGHYDSCNRNVLDAVNPAPGADDDASGVAAVLEMARVMSKHEFSATLIFMAVAGEEQALLGSGHWAQQARQNSMHILGMFDNDIIGNSKSQTGKVDRNTVRLFAEGVSPQGKPTDELLELIRTGGENDSPSRQLARLVRDTALQYVPDMTVHVIYRADRYLRGGDHQPFLQQGYPAVRFTEPAENYHHQHEDVRVVDGVPYGDRPEFVDYAYAAQVTRINASSLAVLARAPAPPQGVQIETARLENDTTLRWLPNKEPSLAGYRIVWRETTSPFWEHSLDVPANVNRKTIEGLSKDNVIFGLEAFDEAGHVSPAVFPRPRRTL
jgi:hypothetical protein